MIINLLFPHNIEIYQKIISEIKNESHIPDIRKPEKS